MNLCQAARVLCAALCVFAAASAAGAKPERSGAKADSKPSEPAPSSAPASAEPAQKVDPKLFGDALETYFGGNAKGAAGKLFTFLEGSPPTDENYAWAQL